MSDDTQDPEVDGLGALAGMEDAIRDALAELKAKGTKVTPAVVKGVAADVIDRLTRENPATDENG